MKDGIDYINIYSKSKTEIGRMLSNFYEFEIDTNHGRFLSVEGYWHWLSIDCSDYNKDKLRKLSGYNALKVGRTLREYYGNSNLQSDLFQSYILDAVWNKFKNNKHMINETNMNLPYFHIVYKGNNQVDLTQKYWWLINGISDMRYIIIDKRMKML